MSAPERLAGRAWRCEACGHDAADADLLGVRVGPSTNVVLVACAACRAAYAETGRLPFGLAHCQPILTDQDITDDLIARGYVDERGDWPAPGVAR